MLLGWMVLLLLITECHFTYIVRLDGTDIYGKLMLPCGYGKVFLRGEGKRHFAFWQIFRLKDKALYYPDSIFIGVNNMQLALKVSNKTRNSGNAHDAFYVYDGDTVITRFFIPEGVFKEDTIVVKISGLLNCKGHTGGTDQFFYYFKRNEKVRGQ